MLYSEFLEKWQRFVDRPGSLAEETEREFAADLATALHRAREEGWRKALIEAELGVHSIVRWDGSTAFTPEILGLVSKTKESEE